jgi:hypothetical protein
MDRSRLRVLCARVVGLVVVASSVESGIASLSWAVRDAGRRRARRLRLFRSGASAVDSRLTSFF